MSTTVNQIGLSALDFFLNYQPLRPPYPLWKSLRLLLAFIMTLYMLGTVEASPWDESRFFPMNSMTFRQFAHRRPQILPFERPGRNDRTCGNVLTKRLQQICTRNLDCPPVGMNKILLEKRGIQTKKLTGLCCDKPCNDEVIRKIFCCAPNPQFSAGR